MDWIRRIVKIRWLSVLLNHLVGLVVVLTPFTLSSILLGSACPFFMITDVCCPFCGMTRAHLAMLRLDFANAFYYHPLFFMALPWLWFLIHEKLMVKKWQQILRRVVVASGLIALIAVYVVRLFLYGTNFFI